MQYLISKHQFRGMRDAMRTQFHDNRCDAQGMFFTTQCDKECDVERVVSHLEAVLQISYTAATNPHRNNKIWESCTMRDLSCLPQQVFQQNPTGSEDEIPSLNENTMTPSLNKDTIGVTRSVLRDCCLTWIPTQTRTVELFRHAEE